MVKPPADTDPAAAGGLLGVGNTAKLYCLERIECLIHERRGDPLTILDLGCGRAENFIELLRRHPHIHYVGVEPSQRACAEAERALHGLNARIIQGAAYDLDLAEADVVVSFSVLEHVYQRGRYMRCLATSLAPCGQAFVNFDSGHFHPVGSRASRLREHLKTRFGVWLARLGDESRFQRFVTDEEFASLLRDVGLDVEEHRMFNSDLKLVVARAPAPHRERLMREWLDAELAFNHAGIPWTDDLAAVFKTRNFVLVRSAQG